MRYLLSCWLFLLAAAAVAMASDDGPRSLVLQDGGTVEVRSAAIKGSFVHLELPDGRKQAYPIENVDLAASGLLPTAAPEVAEQQPEKLHAATMSDATVNDDSESVLSITDADVDHLGYGEGEGEDDGRIKLPISNLRKQVNGMLMKLTGEIENTTAESARSILVEAVAIAEGGDRAGVGRLTIADVVAPGDSVPFACELAVTAPVAEVNVTASVKAPRGRPGARPKKAPWWKDFQMPTGTDQPAGEQPVRTPPEGAPPE